MDFDHAALTRDMGGRRVNVFAPEESLLLLKGVNKLAHEGGKRLDASSWEYRVLRDWIAGGAPKSAVAEPGVRRISVSPAEATLDESVSRVQLRVEAEFSDGSRRDVTSRAVYEPLQTGLVEVTRDGLVRREEFGEPTILVRFLDQSQPVRLIFVKASPGFEWQRPRWEGYVDRHVFTKLKTLRVNPSGLCSDEVFARRAHLDLTGQIPAAREARDFVKDEAPNKRALLVERLLSRPEFADFWASKWADVLKVETRTLDERGMKVFHAWIRDAFARNMPLDEFAREVIAARGSTYHEAPANFYRANRTPAMRGEAAAQVFMGTRLQCAQCHNHPFDRWTQDDYHQWSAVFGRVDYKILENKRTDKSDLHEFKGEQVVFLNPKLKVENPRTGDDAKPRFLGAEMPPLMRNEDELQSAARWLTSEANPLFARSQANRIWYHLMGRGLVEPVDDLRVTNPASHPQLLEELAADLVASGFDLRHLVRRIMLSRAYQLDGTPDAANEADAVNYSHALPRRLSAEQLVDSLHLAFGVQARFEGFPKGTRAAQLPGPRGGRDARNVSLSDDAPEIFLAQFGRPRRELACECERSNDTSMAQAFQFISGPMVHRLLSQDRGRLASWARKPDADAREMLFDLYWAFLTRAPTAAEENAIIAMLRTARDRRRTLEDITWSLVNAKEFLLRR